jgi:hypothetical protein
MAGPDRPWHSPDEPSARGRAKLDKRLTREYESGSLERKRRNDDGNAPRDAARRSGSGYCGWQSADDPIFGNGRIRQDGRAMHRTFMLKTTYPRDYDR